VIFRVRWTRRVRADLKRLHDFLLGRDAGDVVLARISTRAIRDAVAKLEVSPLLFRKSWPENPFVRELVIPFGSAGFVALYEIDSQSEVTVLAIRHQREEDYY
jgi:plasmid stabilization system protein ParE